MLQVKNLSYAIPEKDRLKDEPKDILKKITFELGSGEFLAVLGANGTGKSTLLQALSGVLPGHLPEAGAVVPVTRSTPVLSGKIVLGSQDQCRISRHQKERARWAKQCALLPGTVTPWINLTVNAYVELGRYPFLPGESLSEVRSHVQAALQFVSAEKFKDREVHSLSSGEFQRVALARVLTQLSLPCEGEAEEAESGLKLLLLDEPLAHLDLYYQHYFLKLLRELCDGKGGKGQKVSVIAVIHDINLAKKYANRFLLLKEGSALAYGGAAVLTAENISDIFNVKVAELYEEKVWGIRF